MRVFLLVCRGAAFLEVSKVCNSSACECQQASMKADSSSLWLRIVASHLLEGRFDGGYINAFAAPFAWVRRSNSSDLPLPMLKNQVTPQHCEQRCKHQLDDVFCYRHSLARFQEGSDNINCLHLVHH